LQFNVDDEDAHPVKWYKNFKFWTAVASILTTELLLISAIIMLVRFKHYKVIWFEWWRWLFFFSGRITTTLGLSTKTFDACCFRPEVCFPPIISADAFWSHLLAD
jgi:amino acid permease